MKINRKTKWFGLCLTFINVVLSVISVHAEPEEIVSIDKDTKVMTRFIRNPDDGTWVPVEIKALGANGEIIVEDSGNPNNFMEANSNPVSSGYGYSGHS